MIVDWRAAAKSVVRRVVPHSRRPASRARYNELTWRLYRGTNVSCNCCGGSFRRFRTSVTDGGHRSSMCPRCGSLSRHRVDWLYLTSETDALERPLRLLHIAPEPCLAGPLRRMANVSYLSADYDSTLAMEQIDVQRIGHPSASFGGVICNHVLNFVDDDRAALKELQRVIEPGGWALLQSAVDPKLERTVEHDELSAADPAKERYEEAFLRMYGRDYAARLEDAGFLVTVSDFAGQLEPARREKLGLDLSETIYFCRKPGP